MAIVSVSGLPGSSGKKNQVRDSIENLLADLALGDGSNLRQHTALYAKLSVTDTQVEAADILSLNHFALNAGRKIAFSVALVKTIEGSLEDVAALYATKKTVAGLGNEALRLSDSDLSTIELRALDKRASGVIDVTALDSLNGSLADMTAVLKSKGIAGLANATLVLEQDAPLTAKNLKALTALATQAAKRDNVNIDVSGAMEVLEGKLIDVMKLLAAESVIGLDGISISLTDTKLAANALAALVDRTDATVSAGKLKALAGDATLVAALYEANVEGLDSVNITISDATLEAADLNALLAATAGKISASKLKTLSGSLDDILEALATPKTQIASLSSKALTLTDSELDASQLIALNALSKGRIDASSLILLTGSAADIRTALTIPAKQIAGLGTQDVSVEGSASVAELNSIDAATSGVVSASISGTAAQLASLNAGSNDYIISITDAASLAELTQIAAATNQGLDYSSIRDTAAALVGDGSEPSEWLVEGVDVTIIGTATEAQLLAVIAITGSGTLVHGGIADSVTDGMDFSIDYAGTAGVSLTGSDGNQTVTGSVYDDVIHGGAGNDNLYGGEGNDTLDGGSGVDRLYGGAGDDTFVVTKNAVGEHFDGGAGYDTVLVQRVGIDLSDDGLVDVERITVANGASAIVSLAQARLLMLEGNASFSIVDTPQGLWDALYGDHTSGREAQLLQAASSLSLMGNAEANTLGFDPDIPLAQLIIYGLAGNDFLYGTAAGDQLHGGLGNDFYALDHPDDLVFEGFDEGIDTVNAPFNYTLGANLENLIFGGKIGVGNALDNVIEAGAGDQQLYGMTGNDWLYGATGNDSLYGGSGDDYLDGGWDDDILYGEEGDDWLFGNDGNDQLFGGDGDDLLQGGDGDDILYGGAGRDVFVYLNDYNHRFPQGHDTIIDFTPGEDKIGLLLRMSVVQIEADGEDAIISLQLANGDVPSIRLPGLAGQISMDDFALVGDQGSNWLYGDAGDNTLMGMTGDDRLFGGSGSDLLIGGSGDDILQGGTGNDALHGGSGNDILYGELGADALYGGEGQDVFGYYSTADSTLAAYDSIHDFQAGESINLYALHLADSSTVYGSDTDLTAAQASATAAFANASIYLSQVGDNTYVYVDANGDQLMDQSDLFIELLGVDATAEGFINFIS